MRGLIIYSMVILLGVLVLPSQAQAQVQAQYDDEVDTRPQRPDPSELRASARPPGRNDIHVGFTAGPGIGFAPVLNPSLMEVVSGQVSIGIHHKWVGADLEFGMTGDFGIFSDMGLSTGISSDTMSLMILQKLFPWGSPREQDPYFFAGGGLSQASLPSAQGGERTRAWGPAFRAGAGMYSRMNDDWILVNFRASYRLLPMIARSAGGVERGLGHGFLLEAGVSFNAAPLWK